MAAPVGAFAATVTGSASGAKGGGIPGHSTFRAAPGEANDVTVGRLPSGEMRFSDAAAPVEASGRCRQLGPSEAACPADYDGAVYLEDGDDRVRSGAASSAEGGAGDDVLIGSTGIEWLEGGPGNDTMDARAGHDSLEGGDGSDTMDGGPGDDRMAGDADFARTAMPHRDVLRGGEGHDVVSYSAHEVPVRVDLSQPGRPAGAEGENDEISGFEGAAGGTARNELIGDDANNSLELRSGGGMAVGGGGNDIIGVGTGSSVRSIEAVVDAGPGHDRIDAYHSRGARLGCGPDFDRVVGSELGTLAPDCEIIAPIDFPSLEAPVLRPYPRVRGDRAVFRIGCPEDINSNHPCRGRILLRDVAGRIVGKRRYEAREDTKPSIGVTIDRTARRRMARPGGVEVRVHLLISKGFYERESGEWSVVLAGQ